MCDNCVARSKFLNENSSKTVEEAQEQIFELMYESSEIAGFSILKKLLQGIDEVLYNFEAPDSAKVLILQRHSQFLGQLVDEREKGEHPSKQFFEKIRGENEYSDEEEFIKLISDLIREGK